MWTPDGENITLNLNIPGGSPYMDLVSVRYDGENLHSIYPTGSGHPSMHPKLPFIITDAYYHEPVAGRDGTAPLRLIDLKRKTETTLAKVRIRRSDSDTLTAEHRIDAHPVWAESGRYVVFNGVHNDTRSVYIADVGEWLETAAASG